MSLAQPGPAGVRFAPDDDRNAGEHDGSSWLSGLVASVEPAVVFSSLASVSVPMLADACLVTVAEDDDVAYRIGVPSAPDPATPEWERGRPAGARVGQLARPGAVRTPIIATPSGRERDRDYRGVVVHQWRDRHRPTPTDLAATQLIVHIAVAVITQERLNQQIRQQQRTAQHLQYAVETNREIGAAIGILMATQQLNQTQAFDALRAESQHSHRKLRDVASDVVFTGTLAPRPPRPRPPTRTTQLAAATSAVGAGGFDRLPLRASSDATAAVGPHRVTPIPSPPEAHA